MNSRLFNEALTYLILRWLDRNWTLLQCGCSFWLFYSISGYELERKRIKFSKMIPPKYFLNTFLFSSKSPGLESWFFWDPNPSFRFRSRPILIYDAAAALVISFSFAWASVVDPHHFGNLNPHPDQIKIRIHIKVISWIRIRINLQMTSQNVWNKSIFYYFSTFLRVGAFIWQQGSGSGSGWKVIRIRIK